MILLVLPDVLHASPKHLMRIGQCTGDSLARDRTNQHILRGEVFRIRIICVPLISEVDLRELVQGKVNQRVGQT